MAGWIVLLTFLGYWLTGTVALFIDLFWFLNEAKRITAITLCWAWPVAVFARYIMVSASSNFRPELGDTIFLALLSLIPIAAWVTSI